MGFLQRPDLLDEHANVTERVRKLEVTQQSRTLRPKQWKPHNSALDIALGHTVRALGLHNIVNPLDVRIPPEADWILARVIGEMTHPPVDDLWRMWLELGVGPTFWTHNLERMEGTPAGTPAYAFTTGDRAQFERAWIVFGPPFNQLSDETYAQVYLGDETSIVGGVGGTGAGTLPAHPGYALIDGSGTALPDGGYYAGNQLTEDHREYGISGESHPCTTETIVSPFTPSGEASPLVIPVGQSDGGCPDNPAHPFGSSGQIEGFLYTVGLDVVSPHPALGVPRDLYHAPLGGGSDGPNMGFRTITYETLRTRLALCFAAPRFAGVAAFYESVARVAHDEVYRGPQSSWQTLPLYPGWWGRVECRYDARFVHFRGSVHCGVSDPVSPIFAAYPNHLPIGARTTPSAALSAQTGAGDPIVVGLDIGFRTGDPDDYQHGNGAYLGVFKPSSFDDIEAEAGGEHSIRLDGCRFPIFEGPFDGSTPPYPDLRQ